ncbi:MAG: hypothetical protein KUG71_09520 [Porticoccaceae bacterium]|nr:hypothetical protein [Porticoccaceae bacterium]
MKLRVRLITQTLSLLAASLPCTLLLADQETGWLELQKGYQGKVIGAKVERIENVDNQDDTRVTVSIPKSAIKNTDQIQEIVVVGKAPKKDDEPSKLKIHYEWADDYENDYYGLIITLGKATNVPIRLYFKGDTQAP